MINAMAEQKRQEVLESINILKEQILAQLKEYYLDYRNTLESNFRSYNVDLDKLCKEIIEMIDDKKLESLDRLDIATLSYLASLQTAKQVALDLIKYQTDEGIEELTQHKTDYITELTDIKTDAINSINNNFAASGKGFMAEMARLNNEILGLKENFLAFGKDFSEVLLVDTQIWTTPDDNKKRNYFILLQGASGYDNSSTNGSVTSFGEYRSVAGGLGNPNGRGVAGESAFIVLTLAPNTEVSVTIGTGRTRGYVAIAYADTGVKA